MLDTGYSMLDAAYCLLDTDPYSLMDLGSSIWCCGQILVGF